MFEVYSLVLFAHVMAAVTLVGHSLGSPIIRAALREAGTSSELRRVVAFEQRASRWNPLVAVVLLGSGIYLGSAGWWHFGWFYVSIGGWVVNAILAGAVVHATLTALLAATAGGDGPITPGADALRRSTRLAVGAQVMLANDLALLFVMFNKPGTIESIAVFAAANAALVALALLPRRAAVPTLGEARS
jgi:hypothetical protein